MDNKRVQEIQTLAHAIDIRINLFEGYSPKNTNDHTGEILYWRHITNTYGLFADCDRIQIKNNKRCLFEIMNRYGLISQDDFEEIKLFWGDISSARKWFCHNVDDSLYYPQTNLRQVKKYLQRAYLLSTNKPNSFDEVGKADWNLLIGDFERRYTLYLEITKKGLENWKESEDKKDLLDEWVDFMSKTLFEDKELISNVVADISKYYIIDNNLKTKYGILSKNILNQMNMKGFSVSTIKNTLINMTKKMGNREIIAESIKTLSITI